MLCIYVLTQTFIKISWSLPTAYMTAQDGFAANTEWRLIHQRPPGLRPPVPVTVSSYYLWSAQCHDQQPRIHTTKITHRLYFKGKGTLEDSLRFRGHMATSVHVNTTVGAKTHRVQNTCIQIRTVHILWPRAGCYLHLKKLMFSWH